MRESKVRKKLVKMVYDNLDSISNAANEIANEWEIKTIPISTFREIIKISKPSNVNDKNLKEFIYQYNVTLDSLFTACFKIAKRMNSKNIPLTKIEQGINRIKIAYK